MRKLPLLLAAAYVAGACATTPPESQAGHEPDTVASKEGPRVESGTFQQLGDGEGVFQPFDARIVAFPVVVEPDAELRDGGQPIGLEEIREGEPVRVTYQLESGEAPRVLGIEKLDDRGRLPGDEPHDAPLDELEPGFPDPSTTGPGVDTERFP